jgi:hypothetical protein
MMGTLLQTQTHKLKYRSRLETCVLKKRLCLLMPEWCSMSGRLYQMAVAVLHSNN